MKRQLFLTLLIAGLMSGCDSTETENSTAPSAQSSSDTGRDSTEQQANELVNTLLIDGFYSDDDIDFQYPKYSQKKIIESEVGPAFVVYFFGGNGINFTFLKQDVSEAEPTMTLQAFTELNRQEFGTSFQNPDVLSASESEIDGRPAFERTWQGPRTDNGVVFAAWQSWTIVGEKAFIFSAGGPADEFSPYRFKIQQIMDSVKFTQKDTQ